LTSDPRQVYRALSQAGLGNYINARVTGLQKAPTRGPASLAQLRHDMLSAVRVYTSPTSQNLSIGKPRVPQELVAEDITDVKTAARRRALRAPAPLLCDPKWLLVLTICRMSSSDRLETSQLVATMRARASPSSFSFIASDCLPMDLSRIERKRYLLGWRLALIFSSPSSSSGLARPKTLPVYDEDDANSR